jgi:hypothetical protein
LRQDAQKQSSAIRIQNAVRNHRATNEMIRRAQGVLQKNQDQNLKASQISQKTLDDAMKEIIKEDEASTTISSILRGHKGRKRHNIIKNYPQQALKRRLEVSNTQPSTNLQSVPRTSYLRNVNTKKSNIEEKYKKALSEHTVLNTDLQPRPLIRQEEAAATKISKVIRGHKVRKQLPEIIEEYDRQQLINKVNKVEQRANKMTDAATKIGKVIKGHLSRKDTRNKILKQASRDKQMEAALKKYNRIGERMATRNETPMVLGETAPSRFIQSAARLRKKAFQSEISHVDTRVNLASQKEKQARIRTANEGISRMDNIIQKKSTAGRPRTRSDQEGAAAGGSSSRLSMLSTASTLGSFTPPRKK